VGWHGALASSLIAHVCCSFAVMDGVLQAWMGEMQMPVQIAHHEKEQGKRSLLSKKVLKEEHFLSR